jgi:hypothetical protein
MTPQPLSVRLARQRAACDPMPTVGNWNDLVDVPTAALPLPVMTCWVETETGVTIFVRLVASTVETNPDLGIYRPKDYDPAHPRVWFRAW